MKDLFTDPLLLVQAIEGAIPDRDRDFNFKNRKVLVPLRGDGFVIAPENEELAAAALRALPNDLAAAACAKKGWREKPLAAMLQEWGFAPTNYTEVSFGNIWGDVIFPESLAVVAALAPFISSGMMVYTSERDYPAQDSYGIAITAEKNGVQVQEIGRQAEYVIE